MMIQHEPLPEPTLYILLALAPEAKHGYAIMQEVAELSRGRLNLSTGTLYTALKRMLDAGWIEDVTPADAPRGRKDYHLTLEGRAILKAEMHRLYEVAALTERRLKESST